MSATHTTNLNLNKPNRQDYVSVVTDINDNMDKLDGVIGAVPSGKTLQEQIDDAVPNSTTVNGHALTNDVTVTASDVGLGNVDNTSDANKPVSTAQQTAFDAKQRNITFTLISGNQYQVCF